MINITLKNGDVIEAKKNTAAFDVIKSISMGLYKASCAVLIDGNISDLRAILDSDCTLEVLTFDNELGKKAYRHTAAHVMAQAVKRLYPDTKLATGPATDDGFFYDFKVKAPFTREDLNKIEKEIKKIIKENIPIEKFTLPSDEAMSLMKDNDELYKIELIQEHAGKGEDISFYRQGDFVDLCAGPHLMSTGNLKAVKLTQTTGSYWRGDANNDVLCRVYGTAFPKQALLDEYITALEEAKKRDHNVIGRQLEYFTTSDLIGQGLPILLPRGSKVIQKLQRFVEDEEEKRGYLLTKTPFMAKSDLYKISGHWDHYYDGMFVLGDKEKDERGEEVLALRPMTCPFQFQAYLNRMRSYRDLPLRYNETSTLFRNESSGEMHGLIRVRQFTISEGHLACRPDQVQEEFEQCFELAKYILECLGLIDDVTFRFSKWDENDKEKYIGSKEDWEATQDFMREVLDSLDVSYDEADGEAAFYGPKLDVQMKNVYGKEDTIVTIQIDFQLAERFGMTYVDADGSKKYPYVIHRTSLGCYERTLALLLEKYAGALPLWISPDQVRILPISEKYIDYAKSIEKKLQSEGIITEIDSRNEKIGYKIREAQMYKVPYFLVVGEKEQETGEISVRRRNSQETKVYSLDDFIYEVKQRISEKDLSL